MIAVPVSFGIALFLTELSPRWLKRPLGTAIELLAAVPSIVYGMWGLLVFSPILSHLRAAAAAGAVRRRAAARRAVSRAAGGHRPALGRHHPGDHDHPVHRLGDARRVRGDAADAEGVGLRLGSTTWEVVSKVVLPYTKTGVVGGIMLGLGRALGETMAVTFVIGNFNQLNSLSLFEAANSITSALANEFAEAGAGLHQASLIYLGLVLFFITFVVLSLLEAAAARSCKKSEGTRRMSADPTLSTPTPRSSRAHRTLAAQARQRRRADAVAGGDGLRPVLADLDPDRDACASASAAWRSSLFTEMTPPPQAETGGLANAIFGSLAMVTLATLLGTPIGILAGIYLAEYGAEGLARQRDALHQRHPAVGAVDRHRPVHLRRSWSRRIKTFSGWAGVLALALIVIPVVIRTTENMLRADPERAARSRLRARHAEVEGDHDDHAEGGARRRDHRRAAGAGAHRRRDRAAALHRAVEPVLDQRPERSRWRACR